MGGTFETYYVLEYIANFVSVGTNFLATGLLVDAYYQLSRKTDLIINPSELENLVEVENEYKIK